jgi:hypothetical protein
VSDETRPGRETPGPDEREDALAAWFRPQPESEPGAPAEETAAEPGDAGRARSDAAQDGPDEALTRAPSLPSPDNDRTQVIPPEALKAVAAAAAAKDSDKAAEPEAAAKQQAGERLKGAASTVDGESAPADDDTPEPAAKPSATAHANDLTQAIPQRTAAAAASEPSTRFNSPTKPLPSPPAGLNGPTKPLPVPPAAFDETQMIPQTGPAPSSAPPAPPSFPAAAPTEAIPRAGAPLPPIPESSMAMRGSSPRAQQGYGGGSSWSPGGQPQQPQQPQQPSQPQQPQMRQRPQYGTTPLSAGSGRPPILPLGYRGDDDDFNEYEYGDPRRTGPKKRRGGLVIGAVAVVVAVVGALLFTGAVKVPGLGANAVPTVGFSPSGSDAGTNATQTGSAFLTDWQNGNFKAAANITDNPDAALAALTAYKANLKVSGMTLMPGTASAAGWMTFSATAQVGTPASAWSYSSGMATYSKNVDGYTRWFVKWSPSVLFTTLKSGQKLALGTIPATANKVVDRNGTEITGSNAPSLTGMVKALEQNAPTSDGTPGQKVQIEAANGTVVSTVAKVSDPVNDSAVKTTIDLNVQQAAQNAVGRASNSSMVVIQPSTGDILAVVNNPAAGLDTAMIGKYAPGSTFKTITSTLVLNKGVISNLNQNWDCPATYNADGITLHNSEQESGSGVSFLWDFAQSCNNAFSRFNTKITRDDLVNTAHDYYGFNQKWDVGFGEPTVYGTIPNTSSNSLAEELVGQDQITTSPLVMASVAATVANCSFKQPIIVPGQAQISATALPASTCSNLKTLMRAVVTSGTLASVFNGQSGVYGKTGTAEVGNKTPNSWTIVFKGDYAVGALAVGGNFGAQTAGPEIKAMLDAIS